MTIDKGSSGKKHPVIIIRNKGDEYSEEIAERTRQSWVRAGYSVEFFDAITPKDLHKYDYLDFGDEILANPAIDNGLPRDPFVGYYAPRKDKEGNHYVRKISDTEKSVFYSHLQAFKLVLKRNKPHFIVEHDGILNKKIDHVNVNGLIYRQLGTMILAAGYYTPMIIEHIFKFINKYGLGLIDPPRGFLDRDAMYLLRGQLTNVDGWLTALLQWIFLRHDKILPLARMQSFYVKNALESDIKELEKYRKYINQYEWDHSKDSIIDTTDDHGRATIEHRNYVKKDKKVAIMVSGDYHDYLRAKDALTCLTQMWQAFKGCDFYFQTYDKPKQCRLFKDKWLDGYIGPYVNWVDEPPEMHYDSYRLVTERLPPEAYEGLGRFEKYTRKTKKVLSGEKKPDENGKVLHNFYNFACHQQLTFAEQWEIVPKDYDFYIRVRWDAVFSVHFANSIEDFLELADERVVGFALNTAHRRFRFDYSPYIEKGKFYQAVKRTRDYYQEFLNERHYCIIDRDYQYLVQGDSRKDYFERRSITRWTNFLYDYVIIFKASDMEGIDIKELHKQEELFPAEFGWHQVLCTKRPHYNIDGAVAIRRNTDKTFATFEECKMRGIL
jgi:hypothetical protein